MILEVSVIEYKILNIYLEMNKHSKSPEKPPKANYKDNAIIPKENYDSNSSGIDSLISEHPLDLGGKTKKDDHILIKLYAEKMLRKNLEAKLDKLRNENIELLVDKNTQRQNLTKKSQINSNISNNVIFLI